MCHIDGSDLFLSSSYRPFQAKSDRYRKVFDQDVVASHALHGLTLIDGIETLTPMQPSRQRNPDQYEVLERLVYPTARIGF